MGLHIRHNTSHSTLLFDSTLYTKWAPIVSIDVIYMLIMVMDMSIHANIIKMAKEISSVVIDL